MQLALMEMVSKDLGVLAALGGEGRRAGAEIKHINKCSSRLHGHRDRSLDGYPGDGLRAGRASYRIEAIYVHGSRGKVSHDQKGTARVHRHIIRSAHWQAGNVADCAAVEDGAGSVVNDGVFQRAGIAAGEIEEGPVASGENC